MQRAFIKGNKSSNNIDLSLSLIHKRFSMDGAEIHPFTVDSYFGLLKNLSQESKLELIARLSNSLKKGKKPSKRSVSNLFGSLKTKSSAEQLILEIKAARTFKRKSVSL
jgi:hypothetical protein